MDMHDNLTSAAEPARSAQHVDQGGFALLIALIATVIPLLLIMGASSINMTSRMTRLEREFNDERALAAAEAGIDLAIYMASTPAGLTSGSSITRTLGNGLSFRVTPTFLRNDGLDNDHDTPIPQIDEPDENLYQIEVVGTYRTTKRRIAAYLGPKPPLPFSVTGALMMMGVPDPMQLSVSGSSRISGVNVGINGSPTGSGDIAAISAHSPHTVPELLTAIPPSDYPNLIGVTPSPSLSTTAQPINLDEIQLSIQNSANVVLANNQYSNLQFGYSTPAPGLYKIIYRAGDVRFIGTTQGAGVMFVTGDMRIEGTFRFDGIIYCLGNVRIHGTGPGPGPASQTQIFGAVITGPNNHSFTMDGNSTIKYSSEAITKSTAVLPTKYVAFNGWQELQRP
jgi:hypothetical protein